MTIVVDANIIISGIINPYGPIPKIIFLHNTKVDFVIPQYAVDEIELHKKRICRKANLSLNHFEQLQDDILSKLLIFSAEAVDVKSLARAMQLTKDIDEKDSLYIAFALALNALLWSGDLKLYKGLRRKGYNNIITTAELNQILKGI